MSQPTDEQIIASLMAAISDGFNRAIEALRDAGVVDTTGWDYRGVGSGHYDLVTDEIARIARIHARSIRSLFGDGGGVTGTES